MSTASPKPVFLLAGKARRGRQGPDPLLQPVFAQAPKPRPSIAYVGAASGDDRSFLQWLTAYFKTGGAGEVRLAPTASARADLDEARTVLGESDLVFITGGDVEEGLRILRERDLIPVLRRLYRAGVPFFGLSAGSIMLAGSWVRWRDPDDESNAETFPCLGFAPVLCDVHAEEEDWEELRTLLRCVDRNAVGYGIPAGGALRVDPQGKVTALGLPAHRFRWSGGRVTRLADLPAGYAWSVE